MDALQTPNSIVTGLKYQQQVQLLRANAMPAVIVTTNSSTILGTCGAISKPAKSTLKCSENRLQMLSNYLCQDN